MEQRLVNLDRHPAEAMHPAKVVYAVHRTIIARNEPGTLPYTNHR